MPPYFASYSASHSEELSVEACARMMRDNHVGFVPVVDGRGQVVGVVTDRDLAVRVLAEDLPAETPVGEVMTRDVRICRFDDDVESAERKMASTRKSRLVVTDDGGRCVGVISRSAEGGAGPQPVRGRNRRDRSG